jgi:solute carrier family 25 S-adenosylmethionine transporter 26
MIDSSFLSSFIAGGAAGALVDLILFPLDSLKTRLQLRGGAPAARGSFYRGLLSNMAGALPYATTYWSLYESLKAWLRLRGVGDAVAPGVAAAGAEVCAMLVRNPFDVVKQQMQGNMHPSTRAAVANILRLEGAHGFWAGYYATRACARGESRRAPRGFRHAHALSHARTPTPPRAQCAATCPLRPSNSA